MSRRHRRIRQLYTIFLILIALFSHASETPHVRAELIPLTNTAIPGEMIDIAVVFNMSPGWHTYWQNPGDAGMATSFSWTLPEGFELVSMREPAPARLTEEDITTFVHHNEAIYLFQVLAPSLIPDISSFGLKLDWLECKDVCLPGSAELGFTLIRDAVVDSDKAQLTSLIKRAEKRFPNITSTLAGTARIKQDHLELSINRELLQTVKILEADFFPVEELIYDINRPVRLKKGFWKNSILIPLLKGREKNPEILEGLLVLKLSSQDRVKTTYSLINQAVQN